jgi:hypothetical protein
VTTRATTRVAAVTMPSTVGPPSFPKRNGPGIPGSLCDARPACDIGIAGRQEIRITSPTQVRSSRALRGVRWVLTPVATPNIAARVTAQYRITLGEHTYQVDYLIAGTRQ